MAYACMAPLAAWRKRGDHRRANKHVSTDSERRGELMKTRASNETGGVLPVGVQAGGPGPCAPPLNPTPPPALPQNQTHTCVVCMAIVFMRTMVTASDTASCPFCTALSSSSPACRR